MPVERLDPQPVAREQQLTGILVEPGQPPHAVEALEGLLAPDLECVQDDLGVAARTKLDSASLQFAAQLQVVVDLAVVDQHLAAGWRRHRLLAGLRQILNGETHAPERESRGADATLPTAVAVRAAVRLDMYHLCQRVVERPVRLRRENSGYAAHGGLEPMASRSTA